jgi:hypothetical protein
VSDLLSRFERELIADPELVEVILSRSDVFPPPPPEPKPIPIRCDEQSVDRAIARGAVVAVNGIESRIELVNP